MTKFSLLFLVVIALIVTLFSQAFAIRYSYNGVETIYPSWKQIVFLCAILVGVVGTARQNWFAILVGSSLTIIAASSTGDLIPFYILGADEPPFMFSNDSSANVQKIGEIFAGELMFSLIILVPYLGFLGSVLLARKSWRRRTPG